MSGLFSSMENFHGGIDSHVFLPLLSSYFLDKKIVSYSPSSWRTLVECAFNTLKDRWRNGMPRLMINIHLLRPNNCLLYCVWPIWDPQREPQRWMVGRNRQNKAFNTCCTGFFLILQYIPEDLGYAVWGCGFNEDYALIVSNVFRRTPTRSLTGWRDPGIPNQVPPWWHHRW